MQLFDVRDPAAIKQVGTIPIANHTAECVLDCQYFCGRAGTIIDARGVLDGTPPKVIDNWIDELRTQGVDSQSCHHIREIRPGVLLTACQPFATISVTAEDGGSPAHPKVLYTGEAAKFVHSARWPREGGDKFLLTGGEENFTGRCERNNREFSVYSAEQVLAGQSTQFAGPVAQVPPAGNGVYADGKPVAGALGCSVHWFHEHPTFADGGLVAISEYEDGVRFLQIGGDGSITEQGYFLSLGSSSSSPKWAGQGRRPLLDRLPARDRHPALEGRALRARCGRGDRPGTRPRRCDGATGAVRRAGRQARRAGRAAEDGRVVARALQVGGPAQLSLCVIRGPAG